MAIVVTTPKASTSNAYASVAEAIAYLRTSRLYTEAWDAATAKLPDADGFLVNNASGYTAGATVLAIDTGTGTLAPGDYVEIGSVDYEVKAFTKTKLTLVTGLTGAVADNAAVTRKTATPREKALIWATAILDQAMDWEGIKRELTGRLRWPRTAVRKPDGDYYDYDTYPEVLVNATIELAVALLEKNRAKEPGLLGLGLEEFKLEGLSMKVKESAVEPLIPDTVLTMLQPLGTLNDYAGASSSGMVDLRRT